MSHIYPYKKDTILFDKDLVEAYAKRRVNVSERDVRDLLRVIIKYLRQETSTSYDYKFDIPMIGTLHNKLSREKEKLSLFVENKKFLDMYAEQVYSKGRSVLSKEDFVDLNYKGKTREEIQEIQNTISSEEDN